MSFDDLSDEELLRMGREALKLERFAAARDYFAEHCDRVGKRNSTVAPGVLASYALSLGHTRELKEGIQICLKAVAGDRRNPHIYWSLAQLYILAGSRKRAVDAVSEGLRFSPDHRGLLRIRQEMGVRQAPPIRFLPRDSGVNVKLGKAIHRLKAAPRRRSGSSK